MSIIRPDVLGKARIPLLNDGGAFQLIVSITIYQDGSSDLDGFFLECAAANVGFRFRDFDTMLYEWFAGRVALQENNLKEWINQVMLRAKYMGAAPPAGGR